MDCLNLPRRQRAVVKADFINQTIEAGAAEHRLSAQVANADSILVDIRVARRIHRPQHPVVWRSVRTVQSAIDEDFDFTIGRVSRDGYMGERVQWDRRQRRQVGCRSLVGVAHLDSQTAIGENGNAPVIDHAAHFC